MSQAQRCETFAYGEDESQIADLYLPGNSQAPLVCLLHGGYWRMPWGRDHIAPLAAPLTQLGFAVWNIEYRRMGDGGGYPATLADVGAAIDHLALLGSQARFDLDRVITVGHSAGGQLALWAAAAGTLHGPKHVRVSAAVGLAPVADLRWAAEQGCGSGAVEKFLGGRSREYSQRYQEASPADRLPLGVRQLVLHGTADEDVPIEISRRYAADAATAGDEIIFEELPQTGHMEFVDPSSNAFAALSQWLARQARLSG